MSQKRQLIFAIIGLFLLGLIITGGSYAFWAITDNNTKTVSFNSASSLTNYIEYDAGESKFVGDFNVSSTYNNGIHSTIALNKTNGAANIPMKACINMDINAIGMNMMISSALKWIVTEGTSTDIGNVLAHGNFIGFTNGNTLTLVPNIEVTTTKTYYTVWIWLDASENPSDALSGETLDTVVWTQIDQAEGVTGQYSITRVNVTYQTINATVVSNKAKITNYAVTTTNTEPSTWTSIPVADQSYVYNLRYDVSATGTYYVWFRNEDNEVLSRTAFVNSIDTTAPTCTFGSWSTSPIQNNVTASVELTCIDSESQITVGNLKVTDFTKSGNNINITNIAKSTITDGFKYTITVTGTTNDGFASITLPAGKVKNILGLGNTARTSPDIEIANTYTVSFSSNNANCTLDTTTYADYTATYGTAWSIANPSCTGYTFTGWTANSGLDTTNAKYGTSSSTVTTTWSNASTPVTATWFNNLAKRDNKTVTLTANWTGNTYTATFYYNSNTTSGSLTVSTKTASCTVSNAAGNCTVTVPTVVQNSIGKYNSPYHGVVNATSNMGTTGTITLNGNATYYTNYSQPITIYYPNTSNSVSNVNSSLYRNEFFTSASEMSVVTNSQNNSTVQSGMGTLPNIKGYPDGLAIEPNTATYYSASSTQIKNSNLTSVYAVTVDNESIYFHYNSNVVSGLFTDAVTTYTAISTYYPSSTTTMGVAHGTTTTIPQAASISVGKYNSSFGGISSSYGSITPVTTFVGGQTYYAYYSRQLSITYLNSATTTDTNTDYYRNEYYSSENNISIVIANSNTNTVQVNNLSLSGLYGSLAGLATSNNSTTVNSINSSAIINADTSTYYVVSNYEVSYMAGAGVESIGNTIGEGIGSCKVTISAKQCSITLPSINPYAGYTVSGWSPFDSSLLSPGDYISYTPVKTSYTTDMTYTGYTSTQTINPSELNLWRVLSINGDGTVDLISENVSSIAVYFNGQTGYQNFVGYLNVLASQYETPGITVGSRHFGYNGQTEFITDTTYFVNPAPWTCSTNGASGNCTPDPDDYEAYGGGDTLYTSDYNLVNTVLGTRAANKVGTSTATTYWMASREYRYINTTGYYWFGHYVDASDEGSRSMYAWVGSSFYTLGSSDAIRPIVTLSSSLLYSGDGTSESPYTITGSSTVIPAGSSYTLNQDSVTLYAKAVDITTPTGDVTTTYNNNMVTATANAIDSGSGIANNYGWKVSTSATCDSTVTGFVDTSVNTYSFNIAESGIHYVCVRIEDNAGNQAYISGISTAYYMEYDYTGNYQTFTAPSDGYYMIETWGAEGGSADSSYVAGKGGYSSGYIHLNANYSLYVYVGGAGNVTSTDENVSAAGGWNGGGTGNNTFSGTGRIAGSGGGATDIRTTSGAWNDSTSLNSRIMVAGGGGGSWYISTTYNGNGGSGGTLIGGNSSGNNNGTTVTATGGTQTATSFGSGVSAATSTERPGGGGGYYGGNIDTFTAGGGSSFISGYAGVNAITSASDRTHTNNTLHYNNKYFIKGTMTQGSNSGNGRAKITYVGTNPLELERVNSDLNGVRYIKDCINGSNHDATNSWEELQAIERNTGINVAKGKTVTSTGTVQTGNYSLDALVDGRIIHNSDDVYLNETGFQCVTVDLGSTYNLDEIAVWHYYSDGTRTYNYNTTYVSDNAQLWIPVINRTEVETYNGKRVTAWDQPLTNNTPRAVFYYTGNSQSFTAPVSGYYKVETWGAHGGYGSSSTYSGGSGGYSSGYINLSANDTLYVYVGGNGKDSTSMTTNTMLGGWNGGGNSIGTASKYVGSGGGATDIRLVSGTWDNATSLNSRIMVAGGGGAGGYESASYSSTGGPGGGLIGKNGTTTYTEFEVGTGGTQTNGGGSYISGTFGQGANSASDSIGGGGGYYGGGAGKYTSGSGGGSSFMSGYAGVNAITSASNRTHTNNTLHYSGKYFIDGKMTSGTDSLDGKARITFVGNSPTRVNTALDDVRYIKDCANANSVNEGIHWVEIQAIKDGSNLVAGKTVVGTVSEWVYTDTGYSYITDGKIDNITGNSGWGAPNGSGNQCVTVDLGDTYDLDEIAVWHYYLDGRTYYDNITSVSSDNSTWTIAIQKSGGETSEGKRASAYHIDGGYVLTINKGTCGSVQGSGIVSGGTTTSINAIPGAGYSFSSWTVNSGNTPASTTSASTTITMTQDTTLTANCVATRTLTLNKGTCSSVSGGGTYNYNTIHNISVTPGSGYHFTGWTVNSGNTPANTSSATTSVTLTQDTTLTANCTTVTGGSYGYNGGVQTYTVPVTGYYKLEVWGAQGGTNARAAGGYGGYSVGAARLTAGSTVYVVVGGQGGNISGGGDGAAGYNGGAAGDGWGDECNGTNCDFYYAVSASGGGGATHMATQSGTLASIGEGNISKVLIVAGGGSGKSDCRINYADWATANAYDRVAAHGGGYNGNAGSNGHGGYQSADTANYSYFGYSGSKQGHAGGGGGLYGGAATSTWIGYGYTSGGGSGYIGNSSLVSTGGVTKHMACYGCATSSTASIKTNSVSCVSSSATADCAKQGSGYAKITFLSD